MKENVIDVLMFLFDNYFNTDGIPEDEMALASELAEAGFQAKTINKAFHWLGELADLKNSQTDIIHPTGKGLRAYLPQEQQKLNAACRGFLYQLEAMGVVDMLTREMIIDRAMAIDVEQLSLRQFKRVAGLVIVNSGCQEQSLSWIEELLCDDAVEVLH